MTENENLMKNLIKAKVTLILELFLSSYLE